MRVATVQALIAMGIAVGTVVIPDNPYWNVQARELGMFLAGGWALLSTWRAESVRRHEYGWTVNSPWSTTPDSLQGTPTDTGLTLGQAFRWTARHTQILETALLQDKALPVATDAQGGHPAVHAVGKRHERLLIIPWKVLEGHVLITGTTGSGKTRLLEVCASEVIHGGGAVVVIDPKGDRDLYARCAAEAARHHSPFYHLTPAHPEQSATINVLETTTTPAEVSTRIRALMPSGGGQAQNPFFEEYPLAIVERIAAAQAALGMSWTLEGLYAPAIMAEHLEKLLLGYLTHLGYDEEPPYIKKALGWYRKHAGGDSLADALIHDYESPRDHFTRVTSNLIPAFRGVVGDPLGPLFSAATPDIHWQGVMEEQAVVYVSLSSLLFGDIANRMGRVILQDLIGFLGQRYAYGSGEATTPLTVIIDEFGDVCYPLFTNALNKARGANARFILAQQSLADVEAVMGKAQAQRVLDNLNTKIWCRLGDDETATVATEGLGMCTVYAPENSVGLGYGGVGGLSGSSHRRQAARETSLIRPTWLTALPTGEAFVRMNGEVWKLRAPLLISASGSEAQQ